MIYMEISKPKKETFKTKIAKP